MRSKHRLFALTLAAVLVLSVVGPGLAMAQEDDSTESNSELDVGVAQEDGVVVTVSDENGTVENATVEVTVADENLSYAGADNYTTDENGTVGLPAPEETLNVSIYAERGDSSGGVEALLEAGEEEDTEGGAFGQEVQQWVHDLLNGDGSDVPMGHQVAEFVTENNPGKAPDHAGPKNDTGRPGHAGPDGERGPPEHAGPAEDGGGPNDEADDETEDEADEEAETGEDETEDDADE